MSRFAFLRRSSSNAAFRALLLFLNLMRPSAAMAQPVAILHNFASSPNDGQNPGGALTLSGSTLYGMTETGGAAQDGTIFQMQIDGTGAGLLHSFHGGLNDGQNPFGTLAQSGNTFFGMTLAGGGSANAGVVFAINSTGGGFGLLHQFLGGAGRRLQPARFAGPIRLNPLRHDEPGRNCQHGNDLQD